MLRRTAKGEATIPEPARYLEKAILVLEDFGDVQAAREEAMSLVESAGGQVVGIVEKKRRARDPSCYVGKGKAREISAAVHDTGATVVVVNAELTPAQAANLEDATGARVVDRVQLILDIFARRARSREGKLQVEAACLRHQLSRLQGAGKEMSRLGGGIGTRGPGETRLETDRRRIRKRLKVLEQEIRKLAVRRALHREAKTRRETPAVALVGYTNAGKSTLFTALTKSEAYSDDRLFATLDPTTRALQLPSGRTVLLVDTVGFIRDLPHELVSAFRATLEEVTCADALVLVLDGSSSRAESERQTVIDALAGLDALSKPMVTAVNKIDRGLAMGGLVGPAEVCISALHGLHLDVLLGEIDRALMPPRTAVVLRIPLHSAGLLADVYSHGSVRSVQYGPDEITVEIDAESKWALRMEAAVRRATRRNEEERH